MLLIPLMTKGDVEVQRLAAHAVANLAVNGELAVASPVEAILTARCVCAADNRQDIVEEGGIAPLIALMQSVNVEVQRQSTKAIANLAVNGAHLTILLHQNAAMCASAGKIRLRTHASHRLHCVWYCVNAGTDMGHG
jgi:hypothetical protein